MTHDTCIWIRPTTNLLPQVRQALGRSNLIIQPARGIDDFASTHEKCTAVILPHDDPSTRPDALMQRIRNTDPTIVVIVLLSARDDHIEQVLLRQGCDDVITAPIRARTLANRLLLRIQRRNPSSAINTRVRFRDTVVDFQELRVHRNGGVEELGHTPAKLLQLLIDNANQVVSRKRICDALWAGHAVDPKGKHIDMHISRLRRLIAPQSGTREHRFIKTVYGVGYRLELTPDDLDTTAPQEMRLHEPADRFASNQQGPHRSLQVA